MFLARRDDLSSSFKVFDNKPESYIPWKTAFVNTIDGLNLKGNEELDLLTKWLEGESLRHALRIRAAHAHDPEVGVRQLWQRLDKQYGSPEVIEASLFKRLESFAKISHKDFSQLQELTEGASSKRGRPLTWSCIPRHIKGNELNCRKTASQSSGSMDS